MQAQVHWAGRNLPYPAPVSSHDVDALTPNRYPVPSSRTSWQVGALLHVQYINALQAM